jgi:alpha-1,2-mannosyltransferase
VLLAGAAAFTVAILTYAGYRELHPSYYTMAPVDLRVYRDGGLILRHISPPYDPSLASPLYGWVMPHYQLQFTYTPWAAVLFVILSMVPWSLLLKLAVAADFIAILSTAWFTVGALGYRQRQLRAGLTLFGSAGVLWLEPVFRTLFLGQVELVLMAIIVWDLCGPANRRWTGVATGLVAGIKLVPLIFVPYLLLARKFRQAAMTCVGFAFSVAVAFVVAPSDSVTYWLHGEFWQASRAGFPGTAANQSLNGLLIRLSGSMHSGELLWVVLAIPVGIAGVAAAAYLDRGGHQVAGLLMAALTGLLVSPISWDHHWVWLVPGLIAAVHYGVRASRTIGRAWACSAGVLILAAVFWTWPGALWRKPMGPGRFTFGLLYMPSGTSEAQFVKYGDQPWFREYHWSHLQFLLGDAYVLAGLGLFALLLAATIWLARRPGPPANLGGDLEQIPDDGTEPVLSGPVS